MMDLELQTNAAASKKGQFAVGIALCAAGSRHLEKGNDASSLLFSPGEYALIAPLSGKAEIAWGNRREELDVSFAMLLPSKEAAMAQNRADLESTPALCTLRLANGEDTCELAYAVFSGEWAQQVVNQLPETAFSPFFLRKDAPLLDQLCTCAQDEEHKRTTDIYQHAQQAFSLLMELCRRFESADAQLYPSLVSAAIGLIQEEYQYLFGIEELASSLEVSKHHLIRQFTKHVGMSPGRFLAKTRIDNAKLLLQDREYSIEIIGQLVGYANGNYFCKAFRALTGLSPGEYRNTYC